MTAFSTHPPLTEPVNWPSEATAIFDPARRGDDPQVWTTVAIATCFPWDSQRSTSGRISRILRLSCCFYPVPHFFIKLLRKLLRDRQHQSCRQARKLTG